MVTVLKGGINQGKTAKILEIYSRGKSGDGFITKKVFKKGVFSGYEIVRLSSQESRPFIFKMGHEPENLPRVFKYGQFTFSGDGIDFAEEIMIDVINKGIDPVYIDEIGPVELQEKGFYKLFRMALESGRNLFVTVRESCVDDVLRLLKINDYEIIDINEI
jgi:nucleoside-triphosphatase THEP1